MKKMNWKQRLALVGAFLSMGASAFADAPIDMTAVTTEVTGYMETSAGKGLLVFGIIMAVILIKRVWKSAAK